MKLASSSHEWKKCAVASTILTEARTNLNKTKHTEELVRRSSADEILNIQKLEERTLSMCSKEVIGSSADNIFKSTKAI